MEIKGNKAYLSIDEQIKSGHSSPIDITEFDCHAERMEAEVELDDLREMATWDPDQLPHAERASLAVRTETYEAKSKIARGIAAELAMRTVVAGP